MRSHTLLAWAILVASTLILATPAPARSNNAARQRADTTRDEAAGQQRGELHLHGHNACGGFVGDECEHVPIDPSLAPSGMQEHTEAHPSPLLRGQDSDRACSGFNGCDRPPASDQGQPIPPSPAPSETQASQSPQPQSTQEAEASSTTQTETDSWPSEWEDEPTQDWAEGDSQSDHSDPTAQDAFEERESYDQPEDSNASDDDDAYDDYNARNDHGR